MAIPKTRAELVEQLEMAYGKLDDELAQAGSSIAELDCVDAWTVQDLLAVRLWWTLRVVDWIEAGRRGEIPVTPAEGYRWKDTPQLNEQVVRDAKGLSYRAIRSRLERAVERVHRVIDELSDADLEQAGSFEWAGSYPLARWISMNTVRQYTTARTYVRRALRER